MSKIYKALEKAEREREKEQNLKWGVPPHLEAQEEPQREEIRIKPQIIEEIVHPRQLITLTQPNSLVAEQFKKLRTQLLRLKDHDSPRTLMVTSAMNGEGKTFISSNLAAEIAINLQTHALLVDGDLRNPSLSDWFDLPNGKGLSDYLGGDGEIHEYMFKTGLEKLSLVPAGSPKDNPIELIGSRRMENLIRELRSMQTNRFIIFDSTPALATTEPEILGKLVDGIIFVVRAGVTPRETIQQAIRSLEKEKIIGVVLNDLNFKSTALHNRYFGSDGYYHHYHYGRKKDGGNHKGFWNRVLHRRGEMLRND